jgi:putative ABC transport system permease protein
MAAVWARVRAELRRRWRATLLLALVVGLTGGVVLAAVAGARRTDSAMGRFLAYYRPLNVSVEAEELDLRAVERLPEVAATGKGAYMALAPPTASGAPDPALGSVNPWVDAGGGIGRTSERPLLVAGRLPDPARPLEAAVDETLAARRHVGPGRTLRMWAYTAQQVEQISAAGGFGADPVAPKGPALDLTVTGIVRLPHDLSPVAVDQDVIYLGSDDLYLTVAFWRAYGTTVGNLGVGQGFRLRRGERDLEAFSAGVRGLPGGQKAIILVGSDAERAAARAERAIHVQAIALLAFAALAGVAGLLVVGQGIARQVQLGAAEHPALLALGMTHGQLAVVALVQAALVGAGGALLAVVLAVLASPLTPIGLARQAEVDPGWSVDAPVLMLGAAGVLAAVLARAGLTAWWLGRAAAGTGAGQPAPRRPSQVAERLARAGAPPSAVTGVRLALEPGRAASAVPVRTALVGAVVAVLAVTASLTFAASLDRLVGTPALQGWNWDVVVGNYHDEQDISPSGALLARNRLVSGYSSVAQAFEPLRIGGLDVAALGVGAIKGEVLPRMLQGRAPGSDDELALGRTTRRRLGRELGDVVQVQGSGKPRPMRIVGEALLPAWHPDLSLNQGALLTTQGLQALFPGAYPNQFLVEYAPGADEDAAFASLRRDFGRTVLRPLPPDEVENLRRVRGLPVTLAALLAGLGAATLGHLLVTSVRRRRRDLAVLKTIGFVRGQVSATVAWQATTMAAVALLVGLPLGIAAGRWAWVLVNQGLGSLASPLTPTVPLLLAVAATLLVANLVAAVPARAAAATRPAVVLRSE